MLKLKLQLFSLQLISHNSCQLTMARLVNASYMALIYLATWHGGTGRVTTFGN